MENIFKVDLFKKDKPSSDYEIKYTSNDTGSCSIELNFFEEPGIPYTLSSEIITITILKPNGLFTDETFEITGDNKAICTLNQYAIDTPGKLKGTVKTYKDGDRLTWGVIGITVGKDTPDGTSGTTTNEFTVLNELVGRVGNVVTNEEERVTNEADRVNNEALRIAKDGYRESDYASLKKIIIDENQAANLQNQINGFNSQMDDIEQKKADKSQADNLQGQINTLVVNGTGNSNPEVVQARVNSNGVLTDTLKSNLDIIETGGNTGITKSVLNDFVQGTLDNGVEADSTTRLRSIFLGVEVGTTIRILVPTGYQFLYYYYNSDKTYIGKTTWTTSNTNVTVEYPYYRFVLSKIDGTTIPVTDALKFNIAYQHKTILLKKIETNTNSINDVNSVITGNTFSLMLDVNFKLGNFDANDNFLQSGVQNRLACVKVYADKDNIVGFAKGLNSKYKFAIDLCGDGVTNFIPSTDGAYWLTPYTVAESGKYNFLIAKIDNTNFTQNEITEVNSNFGFLKTIGVIDRIKKLEETNITTQNPLYGKTIVGLGDSFIDYNTQGLGNDLLSKIAYGNNMTVKNYGLSSSSLAYDSKQTVLSVMDRYQAMLTEVPSADYVIVLAGHNDSNASLHGGTAIPIGTNTDTVNTTFKGALNILIKALLDKYPKAGILFLTPFNRRGTELPYVKAMEEMCEIYSIPCFNNYKGSGICFQNNTQLGIYDQANLHLNGLGNEKMAKKYKPILNTL